MRLAKGVESLFSILLVAATVTCLAASLLLINFESTVALGIFDVLFVSLVFLLNGSLVRKLCLLALGNLTGLFWNYLLNSFSVEATEVFGKLFSCFYLVFFPFLSSVWIVSFWALSLGVLHHRRKTSPGASS
jgi:hypothetical protein